SMTDMTQGGTKRLPVVSSAVLLAAVGQARVMAHKDAVLRNWEVFHVCPPTDKHSYVYRYFDGNGNLIYVGMTSNAATRGLRHWKKSDWWSGGEDVDYHRCRNRDAAYKRESRIRAEEKPLFDWTHQANAKEFIPQLAEELRNNHVLGICDCLDRST